MAACTGAHEHAHSRDRGWSVARCCAGWGSSRLEGRGTSFSGKPEKKETGFGEVRCSPAACDDRGGRRGGEVVASAASWFGVVESTTTACGSGITTRVRRAAFVRTPCGRRGRRKARSCCRFGDLVRTPVSETTQQRGRRKAGACSRRLTGFIEAGITTGTGLTPRQGRDVWLEVDEAATKGVVVRRGWRAPLPRPSVPVRGLVITGVDAVKAWRGHVARAPRGEGRARPRRPAAWRGAAWCGTRTRPGSLRRGNEEPWMGKVGLRGGGCLGRWQGKRLA